MTSEELKAENAPKDWTDKDWFRELAFQLALLNEELARVAREARERK